MLRSGGLLMIALVPCSAAVAAQIMPVVQAVQEQARVIEVKNMAFGPGPEDLHVNDVVRWVNHDVVDHTATAEDGSFDVILPSGGSGVVRLKEAGVINYFCRFHPGMNGRLKVTP